MEVIEILEEYEEFFMQMSLIWLVLYPLMWSLLIDGFYDIAVRMEGVLDAVLSFGGVMQSDGMQALYEYLTPLAFIFLTVAIIGIAFQLIVGKTVQKTNVVLNTVLAVAVILLLPWMVLQLSQLSDDFIEVSQGAGIDEDVEVSALSTQIIQTNTRDVVYLARNDFNVEGTIHNTITDSNIRNIDFTEIVHPEPDDNNNARGYGESVQGKSINNHEVFRSKLVDNEDGEITTEELEPFSLKIIGEIPFLNEYYYRYTGNFINMFAQLGILIAVMLFTSLKVIRLFFEIAFANIIAPFVATTDLTTGQRTKQLLKDLVINFSVVGLVMLVFKLFMLMMNYLGTLDLNPIVFTIIMFALGLATIDGPDQAKKLLGIDIGVKDGYRQLMAGLALGSVATKATSGMRNHISNEKGKMMQQQQEKKEAKDSKTLSSGTGSNSNDSNAYSIDKDLNQAMKNDGYMNSKNNATASNEADNTASASSGTSQVSADSTSDDKASISANTDSVSSASDDQKQTLENLIQNADSDLDDKERNVLEKVMTEGSASLDADERQMLSGIENNDAMSTEEKQAIVNAVDNNDSTAHDTSQREVIENLHEATSNSPSPEEREILETLASNSHSDLSDDEKQVLENIIANGGENMSQSERQVLETLASDDSRNISAEEKQVLENIVSGQTSQSDQSRNVLENIIANDSNLSSSEKQVLENVIANGSENMSQSERQVVENLISSDASNFSQGERQVLENIVSGQSNQSDQSRNVLENIIANDSNLSSSEKQVLENVIANGGENISQSERQVVENLISSGASNFTQGERQVLENVISNGAQQAQEQQNVQSGVNQSSLEPAHQQVIQTISNEGNMTVPDLQQNVVRMMNDDSISAQDTNTVIDTISAGTNASVEQREVVENVLSNYTNLDDKERTSIENVITQSANISPQERQVLEKVTEAPQSVSQSDRQVLENIVSNDNNLTSNERTSIENVIQNHATSQSPQHSTTNQHTIQTEDLVRNMKTKFKNEGHFAELRRKHEEMNNYNDNQ